MKLNFMSRNQPNSSFNIKNLNLLSSYKNHTKRYIQFFPNFPIFLATFSKYYLLKSGTAKTSRARQQICQEINPIVHLR